MAGAADADLVTVRTRGQLHPRRGGVGGVRGPRHEAASSRQPRGVVTQTQLGHVVRQLQRRGHPGQHRNRAAGHLEADHPPDLAVRAQTEQRPPVLAHQHADEGRGPGGHEAEGAAELRDDVALVHHGAATLVLTLQEEARLPRPGACREEECFQFRQIKSTKPATYMLKNIL